MKKKLTNIIWVGIFAVVVIAGLGRTANATEVIYRETFESGTNVSGWTWGTGSEDILENDGNPGRYLRENYLVTFTPRASTDFGIQSVFTGDYRTRNVSSVGIDMAIPYVSGTATGRTVTVILLNDNGTPDDLEDDWGAFKVTDLPIPPTGIAGIIEPTDILQWRSYDITVPSQSATLPEGWSWISRNYLRKNGSWARLMRDVDHVGFILGDPATLYPLLAWDVALDNPRITTVEAQ